MSSDKIQDHDHDQETLEEVKLAVKENQARKSAITENQAIKSLETNLVLCSALSKGISLSRFDSKSTVGTQS